MMFLPAFPWWNAKDPDREKPASIRRTGSGRRFELLSVEDVLNLPDPEWLIQEFIPRHGIAQLYGDSGVGKTFVALDMGLSVATGKNWVNGREVRRGRVVYVVAEGHLGIKSRIAAWLDYHQLPADDLAWFKVLTQALPLGDPKAVAEFILVVKAAFKGEEIELVVLDTQARCTEGLDENAAKDMGLAIGQADRIKRETHATVLLLHHSGYEGTHARGSTAVRAALETQAVLAGSLQVLTLSCEKQKDWEEFEPIRLALVPAAGSLVLVAEHDPSLRRRLSVAQLSTNQAMALESLREHPGGLRAKDWWKASGLAHSSFFNARTALIEKELVERREDLYFAVDLESTESSPDLSKSSGACSGEVQKSTHPLRGGLLDSEAKGSDLNRVTKVEGHGRS